MKTKNNNQKTFENQTGRKILFGCSILVGLGLISLSGQTQEYSNQFFAKDSNSNLAMVLADQVADYENPAIRFRTGNTAINFDFSGATENFNYEQEQDAELNIETWMTDETIFDSFEEFNSIDVEKDLRIEDWMIYNSNFNNYLNFESVDQEKELKIESWMIDAEVFNASVDFTLVDNEKELKIEDWMTNHTCFRNAVDFESADQEEALRIESWMIDNEMFKNNSVLINSEMTESK